MYIVRCDRILYFQSVFLNYSFRLQKEVEIQNEFDFSKFQRLFINHRGLRYRVISIWKDLQRTTSFSLTFYAENLPKPKITVLRYKKGWKFKINLIFRNFRG